MIRSAVTISLVEQARGGPFVFWHDLAGACRAAARLGFDAIELFPPSADAVDAALLGRLLDEHGLRLAAMGTGAGWVVHRATLTSAEAPVRERAREFVRSIVDLAGTFGAPAIVGSLQGRWGQDVDRPTALAYLIEGLASLGEQARSHGVPLLFEPLNRYETNVACTIADGLSILRHSGSSNLRLLVDLFHANIEEADIGASIRSAGPLVGHVHFVDSNRWPAGGGHIDFAPIVAALRDIEYQGYASAEALPMPDSGAAAEQAMRAFRRWFKGA